MLIMIVSLLANQNSTNAIIEVFFSEYNEYDFVDGIYEIFFK
jgi:hypothetical protein